MEEQRGGEMLYSSYTFRTSALDGDEWSASRPGRALSLGKDPSPGTHCIGGWVSPRAGLDTEVRGKIPCLCPGSNLDLPLVQSVGRHYTAWATPAHGLSYTDIKTSKTEVGRSVADFLRPVGLLFDTPWLLVRLVDLPRTGRLDTGTENMA
jgi:hypothetical protein